MPPTHEEMTELVAAHASLDDPLELAIWVRQHEREAWLVEVIPTMPRDDRAERPVSFNPGLNFRHPLNLVVGVWDDIVNAMQHDPSLARAIAAGTVLHGGTRAEELQERARELSGDRAAG